MSGRDRANVEMAAHYESGIEENRLSTWGRLERHPEWFTTAYFHHPDELEAEVRQVGGFDIEAVLAVEGPAGWLGNLDRWLGDSKREEALMATIRQVEAERSLLGASPHLLAVAHKNRSSAVALRIGVGRAPPGGAGRELAPSA
jgi:hypothetical protein